MCKVLTKNDDAGRHGVLIPVQAYDFFPDIKGFIPNTPTNYTEKFEGIWPGTSSKTCSFKHYHRYPERRITRLDQSFNNCIPNSIVIVGKRTDLENTYEIHLVQPDNLLYIPIITYLKLHPSPGVYYFNAEWESDLELTTYGRNVERLLVKFDGVSSRGYIPTLREGPTGVGYTFETIIGIEENNLKGPDFEGIEIKCFRSKSSMANKKNLFLREPRWVDRRKAADRINELGYYDNTNSRYALYSAVTAKENSHKLRIEVNQERDKVLLIHRDTSIAFWTLDELHQRLLEKLHETVYIGAKSRKKGATEEFHYQTLEYFSRPSVNILLNEIIKGNVTVELRLHVKENGTVRNHGTAFRIKEARLTKLYAISSGLREQ